MGKVYTILQGPQMKNNHKDRKAHKGTTALVKGKVFENHFNNTILMKKFSFVLCVLCVSNLAFFVNYGPLV